MKNPNQIYQDRDKYATANYVDASTNDEIFRFYAFFNGKIAIHCQRANMEEGWIETAIVSSPRSSSICEFLRTEEFDTLKVKVYGVVHIVPFSSDGEPIPKE